MVCIVDNQQSSHMSASMYRYGQVYTNYECLTLPMLKGTLSVEDAVAKYPHKPSLCECDNST